MHVMLTSTEFSVLFYLLSHGKTALPEESISVATGKSIVIIREHLEALHDRGLLIKHKGSKWEISEIGINVIATFMGTKNPEYTTNDLFDFFEEMRAYCEPQITKETWTGPNYFNLSSYNPKVTLGVYPTNMYKATQHLGNKWMVSIIFGSYREDGKKYKIFIDHLRKTNDFKRFVWAENSVQLVIANVLESIDVQRVIAPYTDADFSYSDGILDVLCTALREMEQLFRNQMESFPIKNA